MDIDLTKLTVAEIFELKVKLSQIKINDEPPMPAFRLPRRARPDKYKDLDWTKSDLELAQEQGVLSVTIWKHRNRLGMPKVKRTKYYPRCLSWDWSKSDTEISRCELVNINSVRKWRKYLGKPSPPPDRIAVQIPPKLSSSNTDWTAIKWERPDVEIARETGLTRERIRQVRAKLGKPKFLFHDVKFSRFCETFKGVQEMTFEECKAKFDPICFATWQRYCRRAGIRETGTKKQPIYPYDQMNWVLPNNLISSIWRITTRNLIAAHRCGHNRPKPAFRCVKGNIPDQWREIIESEKQKSNSYFESKNEKS